MKNDMDIYGSYYKPYYDNCETGSKNFYVNCNDHNVKVDCVVDHKKGLKVYGKAEYRSHKPCVNAVVMLYKYENNCSQKLVFIKETHTDCHGRYEIDLAHKQNGKYVIKVEVCHNNYECHNDCDCHNGCNHNEHHHHEHHEHHNHHCERNIEDDYANRFFYNYNYEQCNCDYDQCINNTINSYRNICARKNRQCENNCLYY